MDMYRFIFIFLRNIQIALQQNFFNIKYLIAKIVPGKVWLGKAVDFSQ